MPHVLSIEDGLRNVDVKSLTVEQLRQITSPERLMECGNYMMCFDEHYVDKEDGVSKPTDNVVLIPFDLPLPVTQNTEILLEIMSGIYAILSPEAENYPSMVRNIAQLQSAILDLEMSKLGRTDKACEADIFARAANHNSAFRRGPAEFKGMVISTYPVNTILALETPSGSIPFGLAMKKIDSREIYGLEPSDLLSLSNFQNALGGLGEYHNIRQQRHSTFGKPEIVFFDLDGKFVKSDANIEGFSTKLA